MEKENIVLISDPNLDPDDLISYLLISHYVKSGDVCLKAVVTTLGDEETRIKRAKFASGVFNILDIDTKVAYGGDYTIENQDTAYNDLGYLKGEKIDVSKIENHSTKDLLKAQELLYEVFSEAEDKSLTLVLNAGMFDVSEFIKTNKDLFVKKLKKISVMGAIDFSIEIDGCYLPSYKSYNNSTCYPAAINVFKAAQENNIPLYITPKETIYSLGFSAKFYDEFGKKDGLIYQYLYDIRKDALKHMWDAVQEGLYEYRDEKWFFQFFTFLDYEKDKELIKSIRHDFDLVWKNGVKLNLYDPIAVMSILDNVNENSIICERYENKEIYLSKVGNKEILIDKLYQDILS